MANFLDNILGGIGSAVQGAGQWLGNEAKQFTPPVQNFVQQASDALSKNPNLIPAAEGPLAMPIHGMNQFVQNIQSTPQVIGGFVNQGSLYLDPKNSNGNIWQTPLLRPMAEDQNFIQNLAKAPINVAQPVGNFIDNTAGQLPGFKGAGAAASMLLGLPEAIFNVPQQIAKSGVDIGGDLTSGQFQGVKAAGDIGEAATPILTIATLGEGASFIKSLAGDTWKMSALKGLANGLGIGTMFGLSQGLEQNKDMKNVGSDPQQTLKYALSVASTTGQGGAMGSLMGSILGGGGKFFFGGDPGQAARLAQNNMIPPETMEFAYKLLGISPDASLDEVRQAYTQTVQGVHPDNGGSPEALTAFNNAYEMVTRNVAPKITISDVGVVTPEWSSEIGGDLTREQMAAARKAGADNVAQQTRLESLKKQASGEIPIRSTEKTSAKTPTTSDQFLQYGSDIISPAGQKELGDRTQKALQNQGTFQDLLDTVAQQQRARSMSNIKNPFSTVQKIVEHRMQGEDQYTMGDVNDMLRGTIAIKDQSQIPSTVSQLKDEITQRGYKVVNENDYFNNPQKNGYQGYHIDIQMPDGQIAEIQIHTPQSLANATTSHPLYAQFDQNMPKETLSALKKVQNQIKDVNPDQADITGRAYLKQQVADKKLLSPMENDFT
jgi:ppGpp synthetase/RelA/SpoT-type nucleotidyltranferase